jgi:hypothetical protein
VNKESFENIPCHMKVYCWYIPMPCGWKINDMENYSMTWHKIFCHMCIMGWNEIS